LDGKIARQIRAAEEEEKLIKVIFHFGLNQEVPCEIQPKAIRQKLREKLPF